MYCQKYWKKIKENIQGKANPSPIILIEQPSRQRRETLFYELQMHKTKESLQTCNFQPNFCLCESQSPSITSNAVWMRWNGLEWSCHSKTLVFELLIGYNGGNCSILSLCL